MRYLITGHTGFKGSWLAAILTTQGHEVVGISLPPIENSLYMHARLNSVFKSEFFVDIRNRKAFKEAILNSQASVAFHLAAQPLVRESYTTPIETYETNVIGTLNFLDGLRDSSIQGAVVITTDKVYKDQNLNRGYRESDELGGHDPYSSSKAAADIATQSWVNSFKTNNIAIARAGNVIGGGDWGSDRLVPDLVNAFTKGAPARIRNPNSIRPWQHVTDCLSGYLMLSNFMMQSGTTGEWNFGPEINPRNTVSQLADFAVKLWGGDAAWEISDETQIHESNFLLLDSTKSREKLGWSDKLDFEESIKWTIEFYKSLVSGGDARHELFTQVTKFLSLE